MELPEATPGSDVQSEDIFDAVQALLEIEPPADQTFRSNQFMPGTNVRDDMNMLMWCQSLAPEPQDHLPDIPPSPKKVRPKRPRDRSMQNAAQHRYRQRLKERQAGEDHQVQELMQRMEALQVHNQELANRQKLMDELIRMQEIHLCVLTNHKDIRDVERRMLLQELVLLMAAVGQPATFELARTWTLSQWVHSLYPAYTKHLAELLPHATVDGQSREALQLEMLILTRRNPETKWSLFTKLMRVMCAWNLHHTRSLPEASYPTSALWQKVLEGLQLEREQQERLLRAQRGVLSWLSHAAELRTRSYQQLGSDMLLLPEEEWRECKGMHMLSSALELERRACTHLYWVFLQVLTPLQEAWLDAGPILPPWSVDVWAFTEVLALQHGLEPAPSFDVLRSVLPGVRSLMPDMTCFQVLTVPCTAYGAGTQLRRVGMDCWYLTTGRKCLATKGYVKLPRPEDMHTLEQTTLEDLQMMPVVSL